MVSIHGQKGNDVYYQAAKKYDGPVWIGAMKHDGAVNWYWSDHSDMIFTNWYDDKVPGTPACALLNNADNKWYAVDCDFKAWYICEREQQ